MKPQNLLILSIASLFSVSCSSTRIDDHSYHYVENRPPTIINNNNNINNILPHRVAPTPPAPNVYYIQPQPPAPKPPTDQDFVQFRQNP